MPDPIARTFGNLPAGLRAKGVSRTEAAASDDSMQLQRFVERLSRWMDTAFEVPVVGWRFGWDALLGLVPGVGDAATMLVALYIVALAGQAGVPRITVARMGLNVAIDLLLGSLPLVGDLFDVYFKANVRNAALLRERLESTPPAAQGDGQRLGIRRRGVAGIGAAVRGPRHADRAGRGGAVELGDRVNGHE